MNILWSSHELIHDINSNRNILSSDRQAYQLLKQATVFLSITKFKVFICIKSDILVYRASLVPSILVSVSLTHSLCDNITPQSFLTISFFYYEEGSIVIQDLWVESFLTISFFSYEEGSIVIQDLWVESSFLGGSLFILIRNNKGIMYG